MPDTRDHYQAYYQDKLWKLLPSIYRSLDTDSFSVPGPLREMVNRIGAQAAILRRNIDRLWEDQSIETCDDWVIAYIANLLATNLVASLDARGQRLDVAKTIYFRRRKGTIAILEEIAANITGWDARVVEFFRRMGRTRHNFDPATGLPAETPDTVGSLSLQLEEGLRGFWTATGIGGWADLRNRYGATQVRTAFDEFFHTADFRRGVDMVGWHNIPRLGVFLWRLHNFGVDQTTPVPVSGCTDQYSFDPTGRQIPLFAAASRTQATSYGDNWVSPKEWQLPGPIGTPLLLAALQQPKTIPLYSSIDPLDGVTVISNSFGVFNKPGPFYVLVDSSHFVDTTTHRSTVFPEIGRFRALTPPAGQLYCTYHYGFSSTIGAGPFDRRAPGTLSIDALQPVTTVRDSNPIAVQAPVGTTVIGDSLTYTTVNNASGIDNVVVQAGAKRRPVLRLPAPSPAVSTWVLTGNAKSNLVLDGLLVSGGDIVLSGSFARVTLTCCTLDPGNAGDSSLFVKAVDGRDLRPCRLWIEANVRELVVDRCITGPIRARNGGNVETLTGTDSIFQAIRTSGFGAFTADDIQDPFELALILKAVSPLSDFLRGFLSAANKTALTNWTPFGPEGKTVNPVPAALVTGIVSALNAAIAGASIFQPARFADVHLNPATIALQNTGPTGANLLRLNRMLLEDAYPEALAQSALALASGEADLQRCTFLGPMFVHRLEASECILDEFSAVEDAQHGCVRFSAWADGSVLPRQYESGRTPAHSAIFVSRQFGQPGYAQLLPTADSVVLDPVGRTIIEGAENGSEMGAFAREKNSIKERSLLIKYREFMPIGLVPVLVRVT